MLFAIIATDVENSIVNRQSVREAHLARLKQLQQNDRLILAGPHPDSDTPDPDKPQFTGSLIVAEFESLQAAKEWAGSDPYVLAGVYADVAIKPFLKVLPE